MARNINFSRGILEHSLNQAIAVVEDLAKEQAKKSGAASSKKKLVKKKAKQSSDNSEKIEVDEEKSHSANREREDQYAKLEAKHQHDMLQGEDDSIRLREALILSEIIGQPRCKARRHRRAGSSYGN